MDDNKTHIAKYSIFLIFSIIAVSYVGFAYAQIEEFESGTVETSSDTTVTNSDSSINYTLWFDNIFSQLTSIQLTLSDMGQTAINSISSISNDVIPDEPKQTLKNCDQHEKLKKAWFDCQKYNQGIVSERNHAERVEELKSISRGF